MAKMNWDRCRQEVQMRRNSFELVDHQTKPHGFRLKRGDRRRMKSALKRIHMAMDLVDPASSQMNFLKSVKRGVEKYKAITPRQKQAVEDLIAKAQGFKSTKIKPSASAKQESAEVKPKWSLSDLVNKVQAMNLSSEERERVSTLEFDANGRLSEADFRFLLELKRRDVTSRGLTKNGQKKSARAALIDDANARFDEVNKASKIPG